MLELNVVWDRVYVAAEWRTTMNSPPTWTSLFLHCHASIVVMASSSSGQCIIYDDDAEHEIYVIPHSNRMVMVKEALLKYTIM